MIRLHTDYRILDNVFIKDYMTTVPTGDCLYEGELLSYSISIRPLIY